MMSVCAPGHTRRLTKHYYFVTWNGRNYPALPKGAHGETDPPIEKGHIRKMARHFGIMDCAKKYLGL